MDYEQIIFASNGGVATITFNRAAKLNAFTFQMLDDESRADARDCGCASNRVSRRRACVFRRR
jgi:enoyl-CoA hydratase/carnithine racemase